MTYTTISDSVDAYNGFLDSMYDEVTLLGVDYLPSDLLDSTDPIAYKCGWLDWCDTEGIDTDELEDDYTFTRDRA